jgi:hypothetical protein
MILLVEANENKPRVAPSARGHILCIVAKPVAHSVDRYGPDLGTVGGPASRQAG